MLKLRKRHLRHLWYVHPQQILVCVAVAITCLFLISAGWLQLTRYARKQVNSSITSLSRKLGIPVDVGRWSLTPAGAQFEDVVIGPENNLLISRMTAEVGLNPFSSTFGQLDSVYIQRLRIKSGIARIRSSVSRLQDAGLIDSAVTSDSRKVVTRLFAAIPAERLYLKSGNVVVVDEDGTPIVTVRGLEALFEKKQQKLVFRIDAVKERSGISERWIHGRFSARNKDGLYRFFVKRKSAPDRQTNTWVMQGSAAPDLESISIGLNIRRLPAFLHSMARPWIGAKPQLSFKSKINMRRAGETWQYSGKFVSDGSTVSVPVLSSQPLGPVRFDFSARGHFNTQTRQVTVEQGRLALPDRKSTRYGPDPLLLTLQGTGRIPLAATDGFSFQAKALLPETPCQKALDSSPPGLLPTLHDFQLGGSVRAGLDVSFDSLKPDRFDYELQDAQFACRVTQAPFTYSAEHLRGPFVLEREVNRDGSPMLVNVNPLSPQFTAIDSVSRNIPQAFVAAEDAAFFQHHGIDTFAIDSALRRNVDEGRIAVGGSTITMQTAKNLFLSHERTISRKLQELFLAWHLENILDKNRILEIYLNIVEFGPGIYGITQAADHYFGKHPYDLNLTEAAFLASVLPAPKTRYRNFCNGRLSPGQRDVVQGILRRMVNLGKIPPDRYLQAASFNLIFDEENRSRSAQCQRPLDGFEEEDAS